MFSTGKEEFAVTAVVDIGSLLEEKSNDLARAFPLNRLLVSTLRGADDAHSAAEMCRNHSVASPLGVKLTAGSSCGAASPGSAGAHANHRNG